MKEIKILLRLVLMVVFFSNLNFCFAQTPSLKFNLSEDGQHYVKLTFLNQTWLRYTDLNPGSTVGGYEIEKLFDIGIRRLRTQFFGQISDRVFFYSQFGMNNFNYTSKQFQGAFFHDAVTEFIVKKNVLNIGIGLTGWGGPTRYSSPSIGTLLTLDAPLYQQTTNGVNDQFLRKLSLYAKGKIGKFDYRFALTRPMLVQNSVSVVKPIATDFDFALAPSKMQTQGYVMYQFLDQEDNLTPYTTGTYLGKKSVLNLGAGFVYQPDAMWSLNNTNDTVFQEMVLLGLDLFLDFPINKNKGNAFTSYVALNYFNLGQNYMRNIAVMNPTNGVNYKATLNGSGDGFPAVGTGEVLYFQLGYLCKKELIGKSTIQFFGASQISNFEKIDQKIMMYEAGFNWLLQGTHHSKISFLYQDRPVFSVNSLNGSDQITRRGMLVLQYQIML